MLYAIASPITSPTVANGKPVRGLIPVAVSSANSSTSDRSASSIRSSVAWISSRHVTNVTTARAPSTSSRTQPMIRVRAVHSTVRNRGRTARRTTAVPLSARGSERSSVAGIGVLVVASGAPARSVGRRCGPSSPRSGRGPSSAGRSVVVIAPVIATVVTGPVIAGSVVAAVVTGPVVVPVAYGGRRGGVTLRVRRWLLGWAHARIGSSGGLHRDRVQGLAVTCPRRTQRCHAHHDTDDEQHGGHDREGEAHNDHAGQRR